MHLAAGFDVGEHLPTAFVALAVDARLQKTRYRLVLNGFTDELFWQAYFFQVSQLIGEGVSAQ